MLRNVIAKRLLLYGEGSGDGFRARANAREK